MEKNFKPGDKFILELGKERKMFKEFEIAGTDLYVKKDLLEKLPPVQSEIIRCKDCRKHNISPKSDPENCCPLYHYRGMSFGGEHDLQFCSYAERREDA